MIALPWDTIFVPAPGMTAAEMERECQALFHRQKTIYGFIDGEVPADYLGDYLAQDGLDPYAWLEVALEGTREIIGSF